MIFYNKLSKNSKEKFSYFDYKWIKRVMVVAYHQSVILKKVGHHLKN